MTIVCIECVKDMHLKKLIESRGSNHTCAICGENHKHIDSEDDDFFQLVKTLVRFNYSEWDYNHHLGGDGYESLFYGVDNIFFVEDRALSDEAYEELVLSITENPVYEDYDKGVSIFAGYGEGGMQNMPLRAIKSELDSDLLAASYRLRKENYFSVEDEVKSVLENYREVATRIFIPNISIYRARIGVEEKKRSLGLGVETEIHYQPYSDSKIGAPPPNLASAGRINRPGVSFLYCATDKNTAIAEIRPHPGDKVSLGVFIVQREAKLFDLSNTKLLHFYKSDKELDSYIPLNTLGLFINRTIPPSERQHYSMTQLIADCIRQLGFDGISFSSTVGNGENIVLFDSQLVKYTNHEAEVVEITEVQYAYNVAPLIQNDGLYR